MFHSCLVVQVKQDFYLPEGSVANICKGLKIVDTQLEIYGVAVFIDGSISVGPLTLHFD
jgi:hypothetical protein